MSLHKQKDHYAAIKDVHVNLENRNHAFDEYGYGPLNPKEPNDDFWKQKAKTFKTSVEEAKKSRCGNCAAFNQSKEIMKDIADSLGPAGKIVTEKANLGFCEMFKFKCAAERTCDAWLVNGPIMEEAPVNNVGSGNIAGLGIGPQGEPGRPPQMMPMFKRAKRGRFGKWDTFEISSDRFHKIKEEKRKGKHWRKYLEEDEYYHDIREYANHPKTKNKPIILQDERTGAMCFARYGKER